MVWWLLAPDLVQCQSGTISGLSEHFKYMIEVHLAELKDPETYSEAIEDFAKRAEYLSGLGDQKIVPEDDFKHWYHFADIKTYTVLCERLLATRLPEIEEVLSSLDSPTRLCQDDIHGDNVLVNSDGIVTGLLDWEGIIVAPPFLLDQYPKIIHEADDSTQEVLKNEYDSEEHYPRSGRPGTFHLRNLVRRLAVIQGSLLSRFEDGMEDIKQYADRNSKSK